jgi:hypothetical protein
MERGGGLKMTVQTAVRMLVTCNLKNNDSWSRQYETCLWTQVIQETHSEVIQPGKISNLRTTGRAIAQAFSRWLRTAAARVLSSGICGRQSGSVAGFLRVFRFPLSIFIPPNSPSSQSPEAGTIGQEWPTCVVDQVWPPTPTERKKLSLCLSN